MGLRGAGLLLAALLSACAAPEFRPAFDADREEGVHGGVEIEWWYHWGFLTDDDGGEWASFSSFFRLHREGYPVTRYFLYDLTDLKSGARDYRSRVGEELLESMRKAGVRGGVQPPHTIIPGATHEAAGGPLKLSYGDDAFERLAPGAWRLRVGDVDVRLRDTAGPMFVEGTGHTGIDRPEEMNYYTFPRLAAEGTVRGRKARGIFWYDHQWGSWGKPTEVGWTWWGLQLDDGTSVNAYILRDLQKSKILRAVCTHDRKVYPLHAVPRDHWDSPRKVRYPVVWTLKAGPLDLRIEPAFKDRECAIAGERMAIWEGPIRVTGSHRGRGYQELVGYPRDSQMPE